jgi:hypothetical protein
MVERVFFSGRLLGASNVVREIEFAVIRPSMALGSVLDLTDAAWKLARGRRDAERVLR